MSDTKTIKYPEIPQDLGSKLDTLMSTIQSSSSDFSGHSTNLQSYIGNANGAVQNVSSVSQGGSTQMLVDTWNLSTTDGNHATGNLAGLSSYLSSAYNNMAEDVQTVKNSLPVILDLIATGGKIKSDQEDDIQQIINQFTGSMGNIGFYLQTAANLINAMNQGTPWSCATGFVPGTVYPTFSPNAFDGTYHMAGKPSGGPPINDTAALKTALTAKGWSAKKIADLMQKLADGGMSEADIDGLLQTFQDTTLSNDQIINFFKNHTADLPGIWEDYQLTQNVPNMSTVLRDMATGSPTNYVGSFYQLKWAADWMETHPNGPGISLVEDTVNGQKAADVVLNDGSVIDLKNYNWPDLQAKNLPFRNVDTVKGEITKQIARYKELYPGQTLTYYFNSEYGTVPTQIKNLLTSEGVTIAYWP